MGQHASVHRKQASPRKPKIRRRSSLRSATSSMRLSFAAKKKAKKSEAVLHHSESIATIDKMDINVASEEELMTLSGIDRSLAKNIVNYRNLIGGFRRIEDLALVSGLGATKLDGIQDELCIGKGAVYSRSSNVEDNSDHKCSSSSSGMEFLAPPVCLVDLNTATIFELMTVSGLNQELAANIVCHRDKKGPFMRVEDVRKVKGVSRRRMALLKTYLTVDETTAGFPATNITVTGCRSTQTTPRSVPRRTSPKLPKFATHRRTKSAPTKLSEMMHLTSLTGKNALFMDSSSNHHAPWQSVDNSSSPLEITQQMYEIMSAKSWSRPIMEEVFLDMRKGQSAFRLATWNLKGFTSEKAENPGVREVICRTVLENGLSLIAVQEVSSLAVMEKLCQELNAPTLKKVIDWDGPRGDWRCWVDSPEAGLEESDWAQRADLDDSRRRSSHGLLDQVCSSVLDCRLAVGNFELEGLGMTLVTVRLRPWAAMKRPSPLPILENRRSPSRKTSVFTRQSSPSSDEEEKSASPSNLLTPLSPVAQLKGKLYRAFSTGSQSIADVDLSQTRAAVGCVKELLKTQVDMDSLIILGDTGVPLSDAVFDDVQELALTSIVGTNTCTTASGRCVSKDESRCYDNICFSDTMKKFFTGHWSIVRQGLDHLAIPRGWGWGGIVSSHCPVWAELYTSVTSDICSAGDSSALPYELASNLEVMCNDAGIETTSLVPNGINGVGKKSGMFSV
ncbi:unnamed protein product [Notodromas monacha]|uniref:Endonuclease/exonuclease/phosphatase family domain-containing protein 1 n=1 Tax=Notodromas monacha TaxID=399045 RepID=A0A7R9BQL0_9CRUS|nr:unnamed protein product [Notodromas monacha]CAG0918500.1 unnamed protein product [Notodromas monacha]